MESVHFNSCFGRTVGDGEGEAFPVFEEDWVAGVGASLPPEPFLEVFTSLEQETTKPKIKSKPMIFFKRGFQPRTWHERGYEGTGLR